MTQLVWRVYVGKGRNPRDFVARLFASSADEAIALVRAQPAMRCKDAYLEAVPAHARPKVPGK